MFERHWIASELHAIKCVCERVAVDETLGKERLRLHLHRYCHLVPQRIWHFGDAIGAIGRHCTVRYETLTDGSTGKRWVHVLPALTWQIGLYPPVVSSLAQQL